ncbi:hypothetical protein JNJ66_02775 [Candidatus Saccharibacteria bacterium]|nr:hypothetical protein [Candidatus Saccharibacteria bacterium]
MRIHTPKRRRFRLSVDDVLLRPSRPARRPHLFLGGQAQVLDMVIDYLVEEMIKTHGGELRTPEPE